MHRYVRWFVAGVFPASMIALALSWALLDLETDPESVRFTPLAQTAIFSGVAAMMFIETFKRMLPIRSAFQVRQVRLFVYEAHRRLDSSIDSGHDELFAEAHYVRLLGDVMDMRLVGSVQGRGGIDSPFNLPAEQFVAQLGLAVDNLMGQEPKGDGYIRGGVVLDALQIRLAARWRHYVQATAIWLAGFVAIAWGAVGSAPSSGWYVIASLAFGGFVAWTARDLSAAVESWRR